MLPISSSAHTAVIPWLLGSDYLTVDPELRKALEVALHSGALAALVLGLRPHRPGRRTLLFTGLGTAPAGLAGAVLERSIEDRLGTPPTIAAGLLLGGAALGLADRSPGVRGAEEAGLRDALWLGLAQAAALAPGVSRNGATLAAARARRFRRADAHRLSRQLALPVITGATLLKAWRVGRRPLLAQHRTELAAGALASLISTHLAGRLASERNDERPLGRYALYRASLAMFIIMRLRRRTTAT